MLYSDLMSEIHDNIQSHYITGYYDLDTALARIQNGGMVELPRDRAITILTRPITPYRVKRLAGRDVTEEQIAARLAEVTA